VLRQIFRLPYNTQGCFLPLLSTYIRCHFLTKFAKDLYALFILVYCTGPPKINFMARHGVFYARYFSCLGGDMQFCCHRYGWRLEYFGVWNVALHNEWFRRFCFQAVPVTLWCKVLFFFDAISDREMYSRYSDHMIDLLLCYDEL
jgi:hypothetical protein